MLEIRKITNKVWKHINNIDGEFILSKFYVKNEFSKFLIVEVYGSKRREYAINEIEVYDIGGGSETFANFTLLFQRLEELNYPAFYEDGMITASSLISTDVGNNITTGSDGLLFSSVGGSTQTTGSLISFDTNKIYNTSTSPSSANITNDLTDAKLGIVQKIYHNYTSEPTYPAGWVPVSPVPYAPNQLNIIYAEWAGGSRVEYWITQDN